MRTERIERFERAAGRHAKDRALVVRAAGNRGAVQLAADLDQRTVRATARSPGVAQTKLALQRDAEDRARCRRSIKFAVARLDECPPWVRRPSTSCNCSGPNRNCRAS